MKQKTFINLYSLILNQTALIQIKGGNDPENVKATINEDDLIDDDFL